MEVVKATGIFLGVRKARLARGTRGSPGDKAGAEFLELSLDSWEAPLVFDVTSVERDARGSTIYRGALPPLAGSQEVIAIVLVEDDTPPSGDAVGNAWHAEATRSTEGQGVDSILDLRNHPGDPRRL
jgi:hypothetical protein